MLQFSAFRFSLGGYVTVKVVLAVNMTQVYKVQRITKCKK